MQLPWPSHCHPDSAQHVAESSRSLVPLILSFSSATRVQPELFPADQPVGFLPHALCVTRPNAAPSRPATPFAPLRRAARRPSSAARNTRERIPPPARELADTPRPSRITRIFTWGPNRCLTTSSSPHNVGAGTPGGGGRCVLPIRNILPMNPAGVQFAIAIRPPGRQTRTLL